MAKYQIDLRKIKFALLTADVSDLDPKELLACFERALSDGDFLECFRNLKQFVSEQDDKHWIDQEMATLRKRIDAYDSLDSDHSEESDSPPYTQSGGDQNKGSTAATSPADKPKRRKPVKDLYPHVPPLGRLLIQTLANDKPLRDFLCRHLLSDQKKVPVDRLVAILIDLTPTDRVGYEYPLARLGSVLELGNSLGDGTWKSSRDALKEVSDILWMLSCPREDFDKIESAMCTILEKRELTDVHEVATKIQQDVEDWMGAVRIQLLDSQFKEWESRHRFEGYTAGQLRAAFLEKRLLFISCPGLPPNGYVPAEWFARECLKDLNVSTDKEQVGLADLFRDELRLAVEGQFQQIVAMFISQDRRSAIETLSNEFPKLLLIKLPESNAQHYARISRDWNRVRNLIESP